MIKHAFTTVVLATTAVACADTYPGGELELGDCIASEQDYFLEDGDSLAIGVGDISFTYGAEDFLKISRDGMKLILISEEGDDTSITKGGFSEGNQFTARPTENGVDVEVQFIDDGSDNSFTTAVLTEGENSITMSATVEDDFIILALDRVCRD